MIQKKVTKHNCGVRQGKGGGCGAGRVGRGMEGSAGGWGGDEGSAE